VLLVDLDHEQTSGLRNLFPINVAEKLLAMVTIDHVWVRNFTLTEVMVRPFTSSSLSSIE
jgi:hypothetical protein